MEKITKYQYTEKCREISGFGGGYEQACRDMVIAGMEWWDENPKAIVDYKEYKQIYGITTGETPDCKKMEEAMLKVNDGCSGAQMQAAKGHIMFAHKNGWEKYISEMEKVKQD